MRGRRWLGLATLPLVAVLLLAACGGDDDTDEPDTETPLATTPAGSDDDSSPTPTGTLGGAEPTGTAGASAADLDAWQDQMDELADELDFTVTDISATGDSLVVTTTMSEDQASSADEVCDAMQELDFGGMARVVIEGDDGSTLTECEA